MSTNPTTQGNPQHSFRNRSVTAVVAAVIVSMMALVAGPVTSAAALTEITPPASYSCGGARISISPPRARANSGRTEQVAWINQVERYNPATNQWYVYSTFTSYASFTQFNSTVTGRSGQYYTNNRMNLPVYHQGFYRVGAVIGNNTMQYSGYIGGINNYCYMP